MTFVRIISLAFILCFSQHISAQEESSKDSLITPKPQALSTSEIPQFSQASRELSNQVKDELKNSENLTDIRNGIPEQENKINEKLVSLEDSTIRYNLNQLTKVEQELSLIEDKLNQWNTEISGWLSDAFTLNDQIDSTSMIWNLTLDSLSVKVSGEDVNSDSSEISVYRRLEGTVESYLSELNSSKSDLQKWITRLQEVESELSITFSNLQRAQSTLNELTKSITSNLWFPEYSPIWQIQLDSLSFEGTASLDAIIKSNQTIVESYVNNNPRFLFSTLFTFLIILGIIIYLNYNSKEYYSQFEEELKQAKIVLKKPVISSIIITCGIVVIFTDLPNELGNIFAFIALLPVCYILYIVEENRNLERVIIFAILYLIYLFLPYLSYLPDLQRIVLLTLDLGSAVCLFLFLQKVSKSDKTKYPLSDQILLFNRIFLFISVVSVLTNVFGLVNLSEIFTNAILGSFIAFIVFNQIIYLSRSLIFLILLGPLYGNSNILQQDSTEILNKLDKLLKKLGFIWWIIIILDLLTIREPLFQGFLDFVNQPVSLGTVSFTLGNILAFFITIQVSVWLSKLVQYFLDKEVFPRKKLEEGISGTITLLVRFAFAIFGFLFALAAAGIDLDQLTIALGGLGVGLGFGLQSIFNNFISGILLALEKPIQIGDNIDVAGVSGVIQDIGFRSTIVKSWDGSEVIIPNGDLLSSNLTNWTLTNRNRRVHIAVRVPFDSDVDAVKKLLLESSSSLPEVMDNPGPYINFKGMSESAMEIDLYCWIADTSNIFGHGTKIRSTVFNALTDAGYEIPLPKNDVKIVNPPKEADVTDLEE